MAILLLTLRKSLTGYVLGFIFGLAHIVPVSLMVVMGLNPGVGPIIVGLSSLAICIFSVKGVVEYCNSSAKGSSRR